MSLHRHLLVGLLVLLAACGNSSASSTAPILVGFSAALTGAYAADGTDMLNSARVAADEINSQGGLLGGRKIQIVPADDQCDAQVGVQAAQYLLSKNVIGYVGGYCSGAILPTLPVYGRKNIPVICTTCALADLTKQGYKNIFLIEVLSTQEAAAVSSLLVQGLHANKVAVLHDNTAYPKGLATSARDALTKLGATVTYFDSITPGQSDYTAALIRIASTSPDVLYYTGYYAEGATLASEWADLGYNAKFKLVAGSAFGDPFLKAAGAKANGVLTDTVISGTTASGPLFDTFKADYNSQYGHLPGVYSIYEYDGVKLLAAAIQAAGTTDGVAVSAELHKINYTGVTGPIQIDADGNRTSQTLQIYQVQSGKWVLAYTQKGQSWAPA